MTPADDINSDLARIRLDLIRVARQIQQSRPAAAAAVEDAMRYDLALIKALKRAAS